MKDRDFLLLANSVILTLIVTNFPVFLKSLGASPLGSVEVRQASQQIKFNGFRKVEQEFWSSIKEVDFDKVERKSDLVEAAEKQIIKAVNKTPKPVENVKPKLQRVKANPKINKQPLAKPQPEKPYTKFLFIGDSIMFDLGTQIQYTLNQEYNVKDTKLAYKVSSGLNRIDYYDWYSHTTDILSDYKPDVLVVMFGGNDNQDIRDFQGKYRVSLSDEWKKAYRERVDKYAKIVSQSSLRKVYWVGQPISRNARYNKFFTALNEIYRDVSKSYPKIQYISTWERFSVDGNFAPILADKSGKKAYVKNSDAVHFTYHGAKIASEIVIDKLAFDKIIKPIPVKDKKS
jgi:hypothetical protein